MVLRVFLFPIVAEFGLRCKAPNSFHKSGSNKACCPRGWGRCAEICLVLLYPLAKSAGKALTGGAALPGSDVSLSLLALVLPTRQHSCSSGCCFLETGSNPLCLCSLDLIWGLNLCCVFCSFLNHIALPVWQEDAVFPPHLEAISALGLQWSEKGSFMFSFHFLFLAISFKIPFSLLFRGSDVAAVQDIRALFIPFTILGSQLRLGWAVSCAAVFALCQKN